MKAFLLSLLLAIPAVAQDPCPERLIPHNVTRTTFDCVTSSEGILVFETRVVEPSYVDNRTCIQYYYFLEGEVDLRNVTDVTRTIRYHIELPLALVPFSPTDLSPGMCYEPDEHKLVLRLEAVVEPGETYTVVFDEWADWSGWNPGGADINGDYYVDGADLALLQAFWGTNNPDYDLNGDGIVDAGDIGILLSYWSDSSE